jgi:hypothetical protein
MKPGDMVTPYGDSASLLSESIEFSLDSESAHYGYLGDIGMLHSGGTGLVIEIQKGNSARVKLMIGTKMWWANVSDLRVLR